MPITTKSRPKATALRSKKKVSNLKFAVLGGLRDVNPDMLSVMLEKAADRKALFDALRKEVRPLRPIR
jgi:hypothetical protein